MLEMRRDVALTADEDLMLEVRGGSRDSFERLFERYREAVWRFFRRRVADAARAEDLVQLSDVLAVEREIARVRGDIERMEAERKSLDRRITYASVTVQLSEERKAAVDLGPQPLRTRGWAAVFSGAVALGLVLTRVLPTVVVVSLAAAPFLLVYRRRRMRQLPHTSSR